MEIDDDGNIVGQTFVGSKSQLNTPLDAVGDGVHANSETNLDEKVTSKRKEAQNTNTAK